MDTNKIVNDLKNCECGKKHCLDIKCVKIGHGVLKECSNILKENDFPSNILIVADKNALRVSGGILEVIESGGFNYELKLYDDLRVAEEKATREVAALAQKHQGILSIGSGSCNDICRRAALLSDKEFAIFATAPSMDGFASGTAPITDGNFKTTLPARQPSIIMGDTKILAEAPNELKVSGFGDVLAKYVALTDWRISNLLTGEYYCENVAQLVRNVLKQVTDMAELVTSKDEKTAGKIMEALVLSGLFMKLADSVRPASGTEHIISHFWEIKKLEKGLLSDFHGRKVGVATLYTSRIYYDIISRKEIAFSNDNTNWEDVYSAYGENFRENIEKLNNPTITDKVDYINLKENWQKICDIVTEELPKPEKIYELLEKAGAARCLKDISVNYDLGLLGLEYHPYMRYRLTLMRLLPMTDIHINYREILEGEKV